MFTCPGALLWLFQCNQRNIRTSYGIKQIYIYDTIIPQYNALLGKKYKKIFVCEEKFPYKHVHGPYQFNALFRILDK